MKRIKLKNVDYMFIDHDTDIELIEEMWHYLTCIISENIGRNIEDEKNRDNK